MSTTTRTAVQPGPTWDNRPISELPDLPASTPEELTAMTRVLRWDKATDLILTLAPQRGIEPSTLALVFHLLGGPPVRAEGDYPDPYQRVVDANWGPTLLDVATWLHRLPAPRRASAHNRRGIGTSQKRARAS